MRNILITTLTLFCSGMSAYGQEAPQPRPLEQLVGFSFPVWYSPGHAERARDMATLCERTMVYMDGSLVFRPAMELKVLTEQEWNAHTGFPVYGMPHPVNDTVLILAAEDNALWRSFIPDLSQLPPDLAAQVRNAYGTADGGLSMQPFFDLLVLHELGHLYHLQKPVVLPRFWLSELFANVFLHTFIAEQEPQRLPALTVFPRMVVARSTDDLAFATLEQLEANYTLIAMEHPTNYGWYQCKWHSAAADIYEQAGAKALRSYWDCFLVQSGPMDDAALAKLLSSSVHPSVAAVMTNW